MALAKHIPDGSASAIGVYGYVYEDVFDNTF